MFIIVMLCIKIYCATCAREHDGQPKLPYGQPNFRVVGHLASCPEKLFLTLILCSTFIGQEII